MIFSDLYKNIVIKKPKITLLFLIIFLVSFGYNSKNFQLDAASDTLLLENDPDLDSSGNKFSSEDSEILEQQEADKITEIGPELNIGKSGSRIATTKGGKQRIIGGL